MNVGEEPLGAGQGFERILLRHFGHKCGMTSPTVPPALGDQGQPVPREVTRLRGRKHTPVAAIETR